MKDLYKIPRPNVDRRVFLELQLYNATLSVPFWLAYPAHYPRKKDIARKHRDAFDLAKQIKGATYLYAERVIKNTRKYLMHRFKITPENRLEFVDCCRQFCRERNKTLYIKTKNRFIKASRLTQKYPIGDH